MSVPTSTRRRALPAAVALVALLALAGPAPAVHGGGTAPPNYPSAAPDAPGATTGDARTPSDVNAALAAERYYSSYGDPPPAAAPQDADRAGAGADGRGVAPLVLALAGALVLGLAVGGLAPLARERRRHRVGIAS